MALTRNLHLVSPNMVGSDVLYAQRSLKENKFKTDFLQAKPDGTFGEFSYRGCKRAKYWLGYPNSKVLGDYGQQLDDYLHGRKSIPAAYKLRRKNRLRLAKQTPLRIRAYRNFQQYVGQTEHPFGSNRVTWASLWYGVIGAWCAMAVTRTYVDAGSKAFKRGVRYAYVPFIEHDARAGVNGLSVTRHPEEGDLVTFDWDNDGTADHVGEFHAWVIKGVTFSTTEGNTSFDEHGSQSNGGACAHRVRSVRDVSMFIHVAE